jgi:hypothetical protein
VTTRTSKLANRPHTHTHIDHHSHTSTHARTHTAHCSALCPHTVPTYPHSPPSPPLPPTRRYHYMLRSEVGADAKERTFPAGWRYGSVVVCLTDLPWVRCLKGVWVFGTRMEGSRGLPRHLTPLPSPPHPPLSLRSRISGDGRGAGDGHRCSHTVPPTICQHQTPKRDLQIRQPPYHCYGYRCACRTLGGGRGGGSHRTLPPLRLPHAPPQPLFNSSVNDQTGLNGGTRSSHHAFCHISPCILPNPTMPSVIASCISSHH